MSWYTDSGLKDEYVFSTRARLARNIAGINFPSSMTVEQSEFVAKEVLSAMEPVISDYDVYDLEKISDSEAGKLIEKHLISPGFKKSALRRIAIISKDMSVSVMVNEEDHIRIQCFAAGLDSDAVLDVAGKIDALLRERLKFAYHEKYGYLTSCPTNCGTALRLSAMMHLPALSLSGAIPQLVRECANEGMVVRGVYGEGSEAPGNIFQISNQVTLGVNAKDILDKFSQIMDMIINAEENLREKMKTDTSPELKDKILRAEGILKSAYMLSGSEYLKLMSLVRLGHYMGILNSDLLKLKKLWVETSPCHLENASSQARDIKRAETVKGVIL